MEHILEKIRAVDQELSKLCLPSIDGYIFLFPEEIIYIQSFNVYTYIFSTRGERIFINKSLKDMEQLLTGGVFYRSHKSYLVNLKKIKKYLRNTTDHLIMENEDSLPISRNKKKELLQILLNTDLNLL